MTLRNTRRGMIKVRFERCDQCLFGANKVVSEERKQELIEQCIKAEGWFVCHKSTQVGEHICCRGYWDIYKSDVISLRVAQMFNGYEFGKENDESNI